MDATIQSFIEIVEQAAGTLSGSDAKRVFHGRGGCYPGLEWCTVDAFAPVLLVSLFTEPPAGFVNTLQNSLVEGCLLQKHQPDFNALVVQHRYTKPPRFEWLVGEEPTDKVAWRKSLRFVLNYRNQNVGLFLDMEPGRQWLEQRAQGKSVLNLFAYTCSLSAVAMAAGASSVVNVDKSRSALDTGRENHRINALPTERVTFMALDILKSWSRIARPGPYDVLIIDPPSYQKGSFIATRDYAKLLRRIPSLAKTGADLLLSLNAPELSQQYLLELVAEHCPQCEFQQRLKPSADFPDQDPQRQLKLLHFIYRG